MSRPDSSLLGLLRRLGIDVRPNEVRVCAWLFSAHFVLLAVQYTVKSLRQSSFIDSLGAERLPLAYLAVALVTYPLIALYQRLAERFAVGRLLAVAAMVVAASLPVFGFWFYKAPKSPWPSAVFYLWTSVVGVLLVSQFWCLAGIRLDARQARRLFAAIGAGGILGSVAGGQIARWSVSVPWPGLGAGPWGALWVAAVLLFLPAVAWWFQSGRHGREDPSGARESDHRDRRQDPSTSTSPKEGFVLARGSRYLQWLSLGMLLAALVAQIVDLQLAWVLEKNTADLQERTAAFGNLYSVMGLTAFVFQILFTYRIHRHLGVGFALRVLPMANGLGTVFFLLAAFFAPGLMLAAVWGLKIAENGFRYSLEQATRELLFLPIPESRRVHAKAFVDVFVQRSAKGVAALALLSVTFGWLTVVQTAWIALAAIALWLWVVEQTHRRYLEAFRQGLLDRAPDAAWAERLDLKDGATLEVLIAGLGSPDTREVCHSLDLLDAHRRGHLIPPWILAHDHPEVRLRALEIFRHTQRRDAAEWVERLLADPDPPVRAAAIKTLAAVAPADLCRPMSERLFDQDPKVRSVAVAYLAAQDDPRLSAQADDSLAAMLSDPSPQVRREAAHALSELDEPVHRASVIKLLYDPDLEVARAAVRCVEQRARRGPISPLYAPIVISHLRQRRLKHEARSALVAYGRTIIPSLQHFMFDPGEDLWVRRALPKTLARIGGPDALEALGEALSTRDDFQRRKVIEALAVLAAEGLKPDTDLIEGQIGVECHRFLGLRLDLWALENVDGSSKTLLERLLEDQLSRHMDNIFALLALIYPSTEIQAARRELRRARAEIRAHALEYLDNLLPGELRHRVFAVIDDLPRAERQRIAYRLYGLTSPSADQALERHLKPTQADPDGAWTTAAALWFIHERSIARLLPWVHRALEREPAPVVKETAELVIRRAEHPADNLSPSSPG